ncbi:hypothetical protein [Nocardia mikamii]|uniref:hypothetical protein n=1 Tax=Nocardia mikamii TaxID=508464 RepID=UPI000A67AF9A|nr:hypothetical protein [Nocardia mikamii]
MLSRELQAAGLDTAAVVRIRFACNEIKKSVAGAYIAGLTWSPAPHTFERGELTPMATIQRETVKVDLGGHTVSVPKDGL